MKKRSKIIAATTIVAIVLGTALMARGLYLYYHKNEESQAAFDQSIGSCVSDRTRVVGSDSMRDSASSDCMHETLDEGKGDVKYEAK